MEKLWYGEFFLGIFGDSSSIVKFYSNGDSVNLVEEKGLGSVGYDVNKQKDDITAVHDRINS